jgi:hypothetical protein
LEVDTKVSQIGKMYKLDERSDIKDVGFIATISIVRHCIPMGAIFRKVDKYISVKWFISSTSV